MRSELKVRKRGEARRDKHAMGTHARRYAPLTTWQRVERLDSHCETRQRRGGGWEDAGNEQARSRRVERLIKN